MVGPNAASSHLSGSSSQLHWEQDWTPSSYVGSVGVALMLFECKPAFLAMQQLPSGGLLCQSEGFGSGHWSTPGRLQWSWQSLVGASRWGVGGEWQVLALWTD